MKADLSVAELAAWKADPKAELWDALKAVSLVAHWAGL